MTCWARRSLLALGLLGIYTNWIGSFQNGWIFLSQELVKNGELPGGLHGVLNTEATGIRGLDQAIASIIVLFWPTGLGNQPSLVLRWFKALGCEGIFWFVAVLEEARSMPWRSFVPRMVLLGLLWQSCGAAAFWPLYFARHLAVTANKPPTTPSQSSTRLIQPLRGCFAVIFGSLFLGAALPAPSTISYTLKQRLLLVSQGWCIYVTAATSTVSILFQAQSPTIPRGHYVFAFVVAAAAHLGLLLPSLLVTYAPVFPGRERYLPDLLTGRVFGLSWPGSAPPVSSVEDGLERFLQWDDLIGSVAMLLWCVALYSRCRGHIERWERLFARVLVVAAFCGPCAAGVMLLGERSEALSDTTKRSRKDE